ncbi:DUF7344 domain-containing protein [Halorussus marinus]|uniref:DUF7344 domain-containing protein n=1 Tax=Halorussus marinus TaxID=2505976 RepID=UPI00106E9CB1|nr:hypothetical protein [Halorussus marinus]
MFDSGERSATLTTDEVFELLSDADRRCALVVLRRADGAVSLGELASATVAIAEDRDPEGVADDERERTATALHHRHLPRLAEAGVVDYDPAESRVELTDAAADLDPVFRMLSE